MKVEKQADNNENHDEDWDKIHTCTICGKQFLIGSLTVSGQKFSSFERLPMTVSLKSVIF